MRLALALGVALAATSAAAYAQQQQHQEQNRVFVYGGGGPGHHLMSDADANHDGWLSRQEARALADRHFAEMDSNNDGKLDEADRAAHMGRFEMRMPGGHEGAEGPDGPVGPGCTRTVEPANAGPNEDRTVTIVCEQGENHTRRVFVTRGGPGGDDDHADAHAEHGERRVEQEVIIRGPGDSGPSAPGMPPMPPMPPHPPMMMMFFANSDEFDRNHDGALSREEFRSQQLRFFDASDGNGDGRIRFEPPPEPPTPPTPPEPPAPPQ